MEAAVGDRIVVTAATLGGPMRDGEIISRLAATEDRPTSSAGLMMGARRSSSLVRTPMSVIRVA
jgi:hypothetical protein